MTEFKFITGDCIKTMRQLPAARFDAAVTSPPYNIGIDYRKHDDNLSHREYMEFTRNWGLGVYRLLSPNGSLFLNVAGTCEKPWTPFAVANEIGRIFQLQNVFHWIKAISIGDKSVGHFKPINSGRFVTNLHEYVFHFSKAGNAPLDRLAIGVPYADKSNVTRWKHTEGRDLRCRGNVWFVSEEVPLAAAQWLALLLDTEGSISIRKMKTSRNYSYDATIEICNVNKELMDKAKAIAGCGGLYARKTQRTGRTVYRLCAVAKDAAKILAIVYPHLIVKRKLAALALYLESLKNIKSPGYKVAFTDDQLLSREKIYSAALDLNSPTHDLYDAAWIPDPVLRMPSENVLFVPYDTIQKGRNHPSPFPAKLAEHCIRISQAKAVIDPFVGGGSSALAAKACDCRLFTGIDIDSQYIKDARKAVA